MATESGASPVEPGLPTRWSGSCPGSSPCPPLSSGRGPLPAGAAQPCLGVEGALVPTADTGSVQAPRWTGRQRASSASASPGPPPCQSKVRFSNPHFATGSSYERSQPASLCGPPFLLYRTQGCTESVRQILEFWRFGARRGQAWHTLESPASAEGTLPLC